MYRIWIAGFVLIVAPSPMRAADPNADKVEIELSALVGDVAKILDKQDQKEVRIGKFTGDGDIPTNFGPEIQRVLIAEFGKRKVAVNKDALIEIKGDYGPAREDPGLPGSKLLFLRVNATLVNTKTRQALANVPTFSRAVYGNDTVAKAIPTSSRLSPIASMEARNEELDKQIRTPETNTIGSKISSRSGSPFAVEVLVVSDKDSPDPAAGRAAVVKDGLAFVDVRRTEYYRVRIHNNAPFDAAIRLSIDGLDQFAFSDPEFRGKDGRPDSGYVIVREGRTAVIRGWFRNLKHADAFVVTEYAKSAVAELNASQGEISVICVQFHAAWETLADMPKDEGGKDAATGRGGKVDVNLRTVKMDVGALRDQVAIRYAKK